MAKFAKGDIVVIRFPLSDLSGSKRRPAFVINPIPGKDIFTLPSKDNKDKFCMPVSSIDFLNGSLPVESYIRPNKIFTPDVNIVVRKAGSLKKNIAQTVIKAIVDIVIS